MDAEQQNEYVPTVAVIGGGWYGCHLADILITRGFKVTLFEKANHLFAGASGKNQFRLHAGFHYPRSSITRSQITAGLHEFKTRMPQFVAPLHKCIYAVSVEDSLIDFGTFKQVFTATNVCFNEAHPQPLGLTNVEGCVEAVDEMFIFVDTPREYYEVGLILCLSHVIPSYLRNAYLLLF